MLVGLLSLLLRRCLGEDGCAVFGRRNVALWCLLIGGFPTLRSDLNLWETHAP